MDKITCFKGEFIKIPSGFWMVQSGILNKIATNTSGENITINIYVEGDYLLNDLENSKYLSVTDSKIIAVDLNNIDVVKILHQLNTIEELVFIRGHDLTVQGLDIYQGRIAIFLQWLQKKVSRSQLELFNLFTFQQIADLNGIRRCTLYRKLTEMGYSKSPKKV